MNGVAMLWGLRGPSAIPKLIPPLDTQMVCAFGRSSFDYTTARIPPSSQII